MSGREDLDIPDPEPAVELDKMPGAGPVPTDIPSARIAFDNLIVVRARKAAEPFLLHDSQYNVQDHQIPVEGGEITVRCAIPTPAGPDNRTFHLMLWTHGGGFIFGPLDMDDLFLRTLCVELHIVVVNVDYRLAPEHAWPTGLNDAYTALKWAAEHTALLSADLSKGFLVTGSSAGANLATVMAHRALNDPFFKRQRVTGQLLQMPLTCHPEGYPERYMHELLSLETSEHPRLLAKAHMIETYKKYAGPATDPECSPLLYSSHIGLAPAYVQICGIDPVRDEGLLYERLLREDGVKTKLEVYPGVGHGFLIHAPESKSAKKFDKDFKEGFRWLLQGGT